ncbi:MAG: hypothetical protein IPK17_08590 [Chloroflexi bacterium]|uniref:hypothetical protein n=1 Tax=Candidatus Flexifilum breve TaxID=3140694 RepID=UPI0031372E81|nr:hypothetical protein [Chloroflexota bacterium]
MNDINWLQQIVNAVWLGGVYSLFSLGYSLVFSVLGVLNLAHSAIFRGARSSGCGSSCSWACPCGCPSRWR